MCDLLFSMQDFLKILPGLILFPFSIYLAWKKLGVKVAASITFGKSRTLPSRITDVVLINFKDKPVTIFAIYAVMDKHISWEVDRFDPPIVLKPLETIRIPTTPYSLLWLNTGVFEPDFVGAKNIEICLVLSRKVVKCKKMRHPNLQHIKAFASYRNAIKHADSINGVVYDERATYAIVYKSETGTKTAIVDCSGFICSNWDFWFNTLPPEAMDSTKYLETYLNNVGLGEVTKFAVSALNQRTPPGT